MPHLKISGGVRISLSYADLLARRGHRVVVIAPERSFLNRVIKKIKGAKPGWFSHLAAQVKLVPQWKEEFLPEADVAIADSWPVAGFLGTCSKKSGEKFHLVQHDERLYHGDAKQVEKVYKLPLKKLVVSTWLKEIMARDFSQESELFLNPTNFGLFHPAQVKKPEGELRILMLNHTYAWKGVAEGLEAFRRVKDKYSQIKLVMFGARGEKPLECDEYHSNPPQDKLSSIYSSCDIYLCPSWDEGSGLPSMEAMACNLALVTYDNGGSRDYAFEGKTALVAKRREVEDLAGKLEQVVRDTDLRAKIAQQGFEFVHSMPSWEEQAFRLEKVLENAIKI